ncbi:hypothetical protein WMF31_42185 [Sorangium sp. So ce1036]|uniref:hypothetical protein n=1 Tax=Sorangium sp. So ce1036 TaxID=3133328 RepID=UPI003F078EBC
MGDGEFRAAAVAPGLRLCPDKEPNPLSGVVSHGVVEPDVAMPLSEYEQRLADTQEKWFIDEA